MTSRLPLVLGADGLPEQLQSADALTVYTIAAAIGATSPVPPGGAGAQAWSTTTKMLMAWTGVIWFPATALQTAAATMANAIVDGLSVDCGTVAYVDGTLAGDWGAVTGSPIGVIDLGTVP